MTATSTPPAAAPAVAAAPPLAPDPPQQLLAIPRFRLLLCVQLLFWSASAVFLMLPKYLAQQLHTDAVWIGLIMSGVGLGAVLTAPAIGALTRWCGRRRCLLLANLAMALGCLLFIGVDQPGPLAVLARSLQGVAGALLYAHGTVLVADLVPPARLPSAIALFMTAGLVPNVISPPAAEWLLAHQGPQLLFAGAGVLALLAALLAWRLPDGAAAAPSAAGGAAAARPAGALLAVSLLFGVAAGVVFTFHQPLALARGAGRVSDFLVTFTLTATTLRLAGGRVIDALGSARVARWSAAGYVVVMLAMAAMGPGQLALLGMVFGCTHGLFFPSFVALVLSRGEAGREGRMAWIGACDKLGFLSVAALGLLAHRWGYAPLFVLAAGLLVVATGILVRVTRRA